MKRKIVVGVVSLLAVVSLFRTLPQAVESSIPSIYYITPTAKTYESIINCSGTIQSMTSRQIVAPSAFVPSAVFVSVGDTVQAGDVLATVDMAATQELAAGSLGMVGDLTDNLSQSLTGLDLPSLLSAYGMSSLLGGEMDLSGMSELLGEEMTGEPGAATEISVLESSFTEITAPMSGVITEVSVQTGVPASAGKVLITVLDNQNYKAVVAVGEGDISKVHIGDLATILGTSFGGKTYQGVVTKIYPTARKVISGTATETVVDVEITIIDPDYRLKPGFTARVEIAGDENYNLITVPYEAIRQDEKNEEYVYIYDNGKLIKTPVVTGRELINEVEILSGLSLENVVIYNPDDVIGEGTMVHIKGRADVD